ncbi:MAG: metallophosphoesterase [Deltaproteobacteria bacterium]|jgi:predicted MPP superfamily phosphohydrolase|nr:metallophosphoesterase [Deltaproteobacteria bacterium]
MLLYLCLGIAIFSLWYVPFRVSSLSGCKKAFWPVFIACFLVIGGYIVLMGTKLYLKPNIVVALLYNILGILLMLHAYVFCLLLILHPFSYFFKGKKRVALLLTFFVAVSLVSYAYYNSMRVKVTFYEMRIAGLKAPLTIAHVPDLHLGAARGEAFLAKTLQKIQDLEPQVIIYNGDLVDTNIALNPETFRPFEKVSIPQYFTTGNHEYYVDTESELNLLKLSGVKRLENETVVIDGINIIGLEYMNADRATSDNHRVNDLFMDEELPKVFRDRTLPTVLIHHSPVGLSYASRDGVALMLTGHTHGGQVFPGTIMVPLWFPEYKGRYQIDNMTLLVSQGVGTFGPPLRLGTFPEIQIVKLVP